VAHTFAEVGDRVGNSPQSAAGKRNAGTITPLIMEPTLDTIVSMFALWNVGATVLPVPRGGAQQTPDAPAQPGDALIMATSGSTGGPKLVRVTFDNVAASAAASSDHLDHSPADRWLCNLPLHHIGGLSIVLRSLREASTVILEQRFDAERTARALHSGEASLASLVPTTLHRTLDVAEPGAFACRAVLVGGGPLPDSLRDTSVAAGLPVLPTYGMTETSSQVATAAEPGGPLRPLPNVRFRTDTGVIQVSGPMVSPGYVGQPARAGEWFTTADTGSFDGDALVVTGRTDTVIITGGEDVYPERVESVLESLRIVDTVCIVGVPDEIWGQRLVALYEGSAMPGELDTAARGAAFAGHEIPRNWIAVDSLPRTPAGKVDRRTAKDLAINLLAT